MSKENLLMESAGLLLEVNELTKELLPLLLARGGRDGLFLADRLNRGFPKRCRAIFEIEKLLEEKVE